MIHKSCLEAELVKKPSRAGAEANAGAETGAKAGAKAGAKTRAATRPKAGPKAGASSPRRETPGQTAGQIRGEIPGETAGDAVRRAGAAGSDTPRPKTARGEATRQAILAAAEVVIGRQGYSEASIGAITREAGVAQGTFYIYFSSKDEVFSELVAEMGRMLRHVIAEATAGFTDRLAAEREGLRAFLAFVSAHPELYRIVQEAQFVDPAAYRAYFRTFAEGYRDGLAKAARAGTIRPGDAEVRAWALMGIARALGELQVVFEAGQDIDHLVATAHDLIENGLGLPEEERPKGEGPGTGSPQREGDHG